MLRFQTYDPILSGADHQRRSANRAGVGDQAFRGVVKIEKQVDRDLPKDERIGLVTRCLLAVVREHFRFHVALHEARPKQSQRRNRERNVELHMKCGGGENHRSYRRRVIVDPSHGRDGGETVRDHDHIF